MIITANTNKTINIKELSNGSVRLKKNSCLNIIGYFDKGWKENRKFKIFLDEENSKINFYIIIKGEKNNNFPFETTSIHKAPNTHVHIYIRSVLDDNSAINYKGIAKGSRIAKNADSYLSHHTLLLSENAGIKTIPSMEIQGNEIIAGHSASVGKIDPAQLFYLQTRGLNFEQAKNLLIQSFLIADIKNNSIKCSIPLK